MSRMNTKHSSIRHLYKDYRNEVINELHSMHALEHAKGGLERTAALPSCAKGEERQNCNDACHGVCECMAWPHQSIDRSMNRGPRPLLLTTYLWSLLSSLL
mmetsp:Transcript_3741/g.7706  ORF Transcript_3741/g.7706 Transcript_3741/m.7706 type:complete len:101 (-) Transcript_3741:1049-1351(-)